MFRSLVIFLCFAISGFSNENAYSIVFVYIGKIPPYIEHTISQARLFNPGASIFLIGNKKSLETLKSTKIDECRINKIACESLKKTLEHKLFDQNCEAKNRSQYWKFSAERFMYIDELMNDYRLENVFQVECDVMLYVDLKDLLNVFSLYEGIGAPFQNDNLGSVSFTYFATAEAARNFAQFIPKHVEEADMTILAMYKNINTAREIDYLPIIFKEYADDRPLMSKIGQRTSNPKRFYSNCEKFNSIFESDLLGTYLIGNPGIIGNQVLYNPDLFKVVWIKDEKGRNVPYVKYKDVQYRLNTLHIYHKAKLSCFSSLNSKMEYPVNKN